MSEVSTTQFDQMEKGMHPIVAAIHGACVGGGMELATRIASNAPMTNYALIQALPRITEMTADHGLLMESLMASVVETAPEAQARVQEFLDGRGPKVQAS